MLNKHGESASGEPDRIDRVMERLDWSWRRRLGEPHTRSDLAVLTATFTTNEVAWEKDKGLDGIRLARKASSVQTSLVIACLWFHLKGDVAR